MVREEDFQQAILVEVVSLEEEVISKLTREAGEEVEVEDKEHPGVEDLEAKHLVNQISKVVKGEDNMAISHNSSAVLVKEQNLDQIQKNHADLVTIVIIKTVPSFIHVMHKVKIKAKIFHCLLSIKEEVQYKIMVEHIPKDQNHRITLGVVFLRAI